MEIQVKILPGVTALKPLKAQCMRILEGIYLHDQPPWLAMNPAGAGGGGVALFQDSLVQLLRGLPEASVVGTGTLA